MPGLLYCLLAFCLLCLAQVVNCIRIGDIIRPLMFWRRSSSSEDNSPMNTSPRDAHIHKLESHIEELLSENNQLRDSMAFLKRNVQYHKDYSLRLRKEKTSLSNSIESIRQEVEQELKLGFAEQQKSLIAEIKAGYELDLIALRKELKESKQTVKQLKGELNAALKGKEQSEKKVTELKNEIKVMQTSYEAKLKERSKATPVKAAPAVKKEKKVPVTTTKAAMKKRSTPVDDDDEEEEVPIRRSSRSGAKKHSPKISPKRRK